jgi:DNA polymerase-1
MEFTKELKPMYVPSDKWKSKKSGVFFTSDEVLQELLDTFGSVRETSKFVSLIQEHREARKERDTYLTGLTKVCWEDGLLHPTFNHVETPTGRLSCRNPNLQNITAKT